MTQSEKERKLKIISLILCCFRVKLMKLKPSNIQEVIILGVDVYYWIIEACKLQATPALKDGLDFASGGVVSNKPSMFHDILNNETYFIEDDEFALLKTKYHETLICNNIT